MSVPLVCLASLCLAVPAFASGASSDPGSGPGSDPGAARVAEHIILKNGNDLLCDHRETVDGKVRLYFDASGTNYMDVDATDIVSDEKVSLPAVPDPPPATSAPKAVPATATRVAAAPVAATRVPEKLTDQQLKPMLAQAEKNYDIDEDLLASVIRQESGGHSHAVSRAGAQGLMQLMPGTASDLGVQNTFAPGQNIKGGTAYLDWLLKRYDNKLDWALAAYNAGPAAVDRWHGIPPYRETRAYVARVIHEYNRRLTQRRQTAGHSTLPQAATVAQK